MVHKGTLRIETERLVLRKFKSNDAKAVFNNWLSDPEVSKYARQQIHKSIDETINYLDDIVVAYSNDNNYYWAITLLNSDEPIGRINITGINEVLNRFMSAL